MKVFDTTRKINLFRINRSSNLHKIITIKNLILNFMNFSYEKF